MSFLKCIFFLILFSTFEFGSIEDKVLGWFKENGWTVLNRAKTGKRSGSLGMCKKIWSKKKIKSVINECGGLKEFYTKYPSAYGVVCRNGWLDELFPNRNKHLSKCATEINMLSLSGEHIATFKTQKDADLYLKKNSIKHNGKIIRECLYGERDSAYGFKWEFVNP